MPLDYNTRSNLIDALSESMGVSAKDPQLSSVLARYDKGTGTLYCGNGKIYRKEAIEEARNAFIRQQERIKSTGQEGAFMYALDIAINIIDVYLNDSTVANKTLKVDDK